MIKRQIVNGEVGPAFITAEWLTIPEEKATPLAAKRKGGARRARSGTEEAAPKKKTKQRRQGSDDGDDAPEPAADDVTGWDEGTEPGGMVMDYTTGEEVMRRSYFWSYRCESARSLTTDLVFPLLYHRCRKHLCNGSTQGDSERNIHVSENLWRR